VIIVLGGSGYIGCAFLAALEARGWPHRSLSRAEADYTRPGVLLDFLRSQKPSFLINAAGYAGVPNVDACETARAETLLGNTLLPQAVAMACAVTGTPWGHVSSGCIYAGAKIAGPSGTRIEKDLARPEIAPFLAGDRSAVSGFTEDDAPNFCFREGPCSFYSGSKALGEEAVAAVGGAYVWRVRIPFDEEDHPRNYLTKIQRYPRVYDNTNSLSHRKELAGACLELWERRAPFGVYNVTNPGFVTTRQVVELIRRVLKPDRAFEFWANDEEFYRLGARTPRSNCILDTRKLQAAGVRMRPVEEALEDALRRWTPERSVR
jgi:dTDP-4-dehydrorhamnose reductase